jgi:N utilization substance protein A
MPLPCPTFEYLIIAEVAGVLIDEGFASVDDIADADAASLETVEEFDATMVEELQERASDAQLGLHQPQLN